MKFNKKKVVKVLPFLMFGYFANKLSQTYQAATGANIGDKIMSTVNGIGAMFRNPLPSFNPIDLLVGAAVGALVMLVIYVKGKNAKKYRKGVEYGSARWGNAEDIKPYTADKFEDNIILTETERLTMDSRPKAGAKFSRNKNVLVVGGSGSGKTRFFVKPNLLQMHSSEHYTQPPKHFTEDTLLSAMERAGTDEITEEVERSGLGTPATRASIIEKLTKSGFIKREKKNLIVTDSGKDLISVMPDIVKSAALTAEWENSLSLMAQGKFTSEQFMADIGKLTNDIISVAKSNVDESKVTPNSGGEVIGVCPRCKKNIIETPKAYSCEDRSCGFVLWKDNKFFQSAKKAFTKEMAKALITDGKIAVKGLYSQKSGRNYDATVCLDDTGTYVNFKLEFAPRKINKIILKIG